MDPRGQTRWRIDRRIGVRAAACGDREDRWIVRRISTFERALDRARDAKESSAAAMRRDAQPRDLGV
jgi:hypothetical protein